MLLVVNAGAVRQRRGFALLEDFERVPLAEQRLARAPGQRAISVVRIGNAAFAIAADDNIAVGFEKIAGAFAGFLELPVAVGNFLDTAFERTHLRGECAIAIDKKRDHRAGERKQRAGADGKQMRIVKAVVGRMDIGHQREDDAGGNRKDQPHAREVERAPTERASASRLFGIVPHARAFSLFAGFAAHGGYRCRAGVLRGLSMASAARLAGGGFRFHFIPAAGVGRG